jgi:hypothetical protein
LTYSKELLLTAEKLLQVVDDQQPSQSDCNRAVSTLYYALFDCLCSVVADRVAGSVDAAAIPSAPWTRVYRSLDHKFVRDTLQSVAQLDGSDVKSNIKFVASTFNKILQHREEADYDRSKDFDLPTIRNLLSEVRTAISLLEGGFDGDDTSGRFTDMIVALLLPKPKR